MGAGNDPRYSSARTFETFPFPWPPGQEQKESEKVKAIAQAAQRLVEKRDAWLRPSDASKEELKKRTLTNLYNARPAWLAEAHRKLDEAVFAAYGLASDPHGYRIARAVTQAEPRTCCMMLAASSRCSLSEGWK